MTAFSRSPHDGVVVAGAVFRGIMDLARDWPEMNEELARQLDGASAVGSLSLDLLAPELQSLAEAALAYACERAVRGQRSPRSGDDVASGERLILGAESVQAFLGHVTFRESADAYDDDPDPLSPR